MARGNGKRKPPKVKAVGRVATLSSGSASKQGDSIDSDDSFFDDSDDQEDKDSVFSQKEEDDGTADEDGAPRKTKAEEGDKKDGKDPGEQSGRTVTLTIEDIRR